MGMTDVRLVYADELHADFPRPDTLSPDINATVPTVVDTLFAQNSIAAHEVGISFEPATETSQMNGEISWGKVQNSSIASIEIQKASLGGVDGPKYTGAITYAYVKV